MTTKKALGAIAMAALLVLAGCSSAVPGTNTTAQTDDGSVDGAESVDSAALTFYISDRPGAIDDFEHLNVTITKVGLHEAGGDDAEGDETEVDDEDADETSANDTTAATENADLVETTTVEDPNETTYTMTSTEETETEEDETETEEPEETEESESAGDDETEGEADGADGETSSEWVMQDVDNETVDLTKLQGANATAIGNLSVPAGEYDKVFVYVSEVNATLTNGESVNVKLPSSKLQINKNFELSANSSPDFVFDINVHKAGNSGKYILRPVVGESGTGDQVEIQKVDKNGKPENPGAKGDKGAKGGNDEGDEDANETEDEESESSLEASLAGAVRAGENVTVSATNADGPVANATVEVNGETVGETNADGELTFTVPDTEELEVTVTKGDAEAELERDVKGGNGGGGNGYGDVQSLSGHALA